VSVFVDFMYGLKPVPFKLHLDLALGADCEVRELKAAGKGSAGLALPFPAGWVICFASLRQDEQAGFQQLLRQPVKGLREFVGDGTDAHSQKRRGFYLRVLLDDDAAEQLTVERAELVEAGFDIEDEDDCVLECFDGTARDPSAGDGFAEDGRRPAHLHGGIQIAAQGSLGVLSVKGQTGVRLCGSDRVRGLRPG